MCIHLTTGWDTTKHAKTLRELELAKKAEMQCHAEFVAAVGCRNTMVDRLKAKQEALSQVLSEVTESALRSHEFEIGRLDVC